MPSTPHSVDGFPTARRCPFDPPSAFAALRAERPIVRMAYPGGSDGWLVTGYALSRDALTHPALSARHELRASPIPMPLTPAAAPPGVFIGMDAPEHTRYRGPLNRHFTVRRVRKLEPAIEQATAERISALEALEGAGSPADLMAEFAMPIPVQVISELLGSTDEITDEIQRLRATTLDRGSPSVDAAAAVGATNARMTDLVRLRRASPSDDLLSVLITDGDLNDEELAGLAMMMLIAGHETTANMIAMAIYLLLSDEALRVAVLGLSDPYDTRGAELSDDMVNELLRHLSVTQFVSRAATEDLELGGVRISAGETVTVSLSAANRDPEQFDDPETFRTEGPVNSHIAFGHGLHQCIGHNLARSEMKIAIPALFRAFPRLQLAGKEAEFGTREGFTIHGVDRLPVTW
ncbi:cytochrome P450 [Streptomyces sp. NBC_01795]|uniref:cytochrome P450 n=1 Tax=Streptomyces sp. NBC_01795 TaxID=2975943 RepID=UPI002DDB0797|nr:cytochrome P450 [Streptomyces sp. NBC_01795]WSA95902.1 cytochrome P450 [Streptomyces sp. NBC_01795]